MKTTINTQEIEKFTKIADKWWDETGEFKPLHMLNPVRIAYIKQQILDAGFKIENLDILDIGCGGGLLAEPLARLGANVTAIDAGETNVEVAKLHSMREDLDINYQCCTAEELATQKKKFDIVLNMEVIEHVDNVELFMKSVASLVKKDGLLFTATLNRTIKSFMFGIIGAEYIMRWLPKNTHDWRKFLKPSEIAKYYENNNIKLQNMMGINYNPLKQNFTLTKDLSVNYMMVGRKS